MDIVKTEHSGYRLLKESDPLVIFFLEVPCI